MTRLQLIATCFSLTFSMSTAGCSAVPTGMPSLLPSWGATAAEPGTREWWKKNQSRAELVPGKGYRVDGVAGYFDENGRPMDAPMAEDALVFSAEDQPATGLLPGVDPKVSYNKAKAAVGLGPNQERAKAAYEAGQKLYAEGKYARAAKRFEEAAGRWPNSTLEQQAMLHQAHSYFFDDQYVDARDTYVKVLEKYPNSGQVDSIVERLWAIGQYWEKHHQQSPDLALTPNLLDESRPWFDTLGHAVKTYENIQLYDPTGPRADDAIMATAGIYFRGGRFNDADHYYQLLREQYPRSEFQFEAHLLGLRSKLQKYQGPKYDGTPLKEAKRLAIKLQTQFAGRLSPEERERLQETEAEVARAIVQRDIAMAQHYENIEHYRAAQIYYAEAVKKHPESQLAAEVRERMEQIASKPPEPEEPVKWLIDMFPENPERTRVARVPELKDSRTGDSETRLAEYEEETVDR